MTILRCFTGKLITVQPVFLLPKGDGVFSKDPRQGLLFEAVRKWMVDEKREADANKISSVWEYISVSYWAKGQAQ